MPKLLLSLPTGDVSKELTGDVITIGRTANNKIQIDHHSVSAQHAKLILSNGVYKLKDLDSTNRTHVNGIVVKEAELTESCFVRFGSIECVYKTEGVSAQEEAAKQQLTSQLAELQRQMEALMKARDVISLQNQALTKERDELLITVDTSADQLSDARKQIEQLSATAAKATPPGAISAMLAESQKQLEAVTKERDALLVSNRELQARLDSAAAQPVAAPQVIAAPQIVAEPRVVAAPQIAAAPAAPQIAAKSMTLAQKVAAQKVQADMDESVEEFEEEEEEQLVGAGAGQAVAAVAAGGTAPRSPSIGSWLNRGNKKKESSQISAMPAAKASPVTPAAPDAKNGGLGNVTMPPALRLVKPGQASGPAAPALGSPAVKIGRASANVAPQNPDIKPAWELLNTMRRSLHYFLRHQDDLKVLGEMKDNGNALSEMSKGDVLRPIHELAAALESLLADLHSSPVNINASTLRTIGQSIDFLATLIDESNLSRIKDVTTARVFAIDDDEGILETIKGTMEMVNLNITTSSGSNDGLTKLSESNYDLIFLDVGLPEMNGMDICSRVRAMPHHQKTPIVFLTGEATVQNRVQSTLNGGNDLIGKPFSILELAVKAIVWIFKGQLGLIAEGNPGK